MKLVFYITLITIVVCCCSGNAPQLGDTLMDNVINTKCNDDLIQVLKDLSSKLAVQMFDSHGKLSQGILSGSLIWPGSFKDCIGAPLDKDGHGDIHRQYCVTKWILNLNEEYKNLRVTIGLCVSDSCSEESIKIAMKNTSHVLDRVPLLKMLSNRLTLDNVICKAKERPLDAPSIIYLTIISVFILFAILGSSLTVYDYWKINNSDRRSLLINNTSLIYGALRQSESSFNDTKDAEYQQPTDTRTQEVSEDRTDLISSKGTDLETVMSNVQPPVSIARRIFQCFSIFPNGQKILSTEHTTGYLESIHGIRFLSLSWILLGHTYLKAIPILGNLMETRKEMDKFLFQIIFQGTLAVDSFFLISGFLLTYLFLKEATKKDGQISWLYFYIHRVWRLTPVYITVVFFYMLIFKYVGSGPFWNDNHCDASRHLWWRFFFYINNFISIRKMCVDWSWYLANDMQFYLISPLFLYPLWKWPLAGFAILGCFLIVTWTITAILSYTYDLVPLFFGMAQTKDVPAYEERMWNSFDVIYDKPYCRIAPYLIGAVLGYIFYKTGDKKNFLNWWQQFLGWIIATGCSLSVVFGLYHVDMNKTIALFYNSLARSSFVIGLAWLIYACETGHGGFLTKFLTWKFWIPLSRLTYCAYLVHPLIINSYYRIYEVPLHFSELTMVTNYLGFLVMSYGLAFAVSLVFESPFMNLEKLLVKKNKMS